MKATPQQTVFNVMVAAHYRAKIRASLRLARECARNSWKEPGELREEYRRLTSEALQDARYWKALLDELKGQQ